MRESFVAMGSIAAGHGQGPSPARSLFLASGAVAAALLLSLFLSEVAHIRPPVYAQVHLYGAIFAAARIGGLQAGLAAFVLALGLSDYFLTEPLYQLFTIDDLPDFLTFGLAAGGSVWIGYLGRRMAEGRQRIEP
jgi:K+-sensing histidine kinase KdpD